jgi:6-phosphogluconate dehydrogenase
MDTTSKNEIGVIGLSVMGANLAMNIAEHGFVTAVYNRSREKTEQLIERYGKQGMTAYFDLEEFVASLATPRRVLLMVQSGAAVDDVIAKLVPLLSAGDMIIDGGNSFFRDTIRREKELKEQDILFVGMGVSGGEEGARRGPALMPGGSLTAWIALEPILRAISAKDFHGGSCVVHIGENGAGHYVKMVHNGIEYIDMQLIAEIYSIMKEGLGMTNEKIADTFEYWNEGRLNSFLIEITAKIMRARDEQGKFVIDTIVDSAGSKGTGKWTGEESLELGVPSFGFIAAVLARYASVYKKKRTVLAETFAEKNIESQGMKISLVDLEKALYTSKILAYAQGYELLSEAAQTYDWQLDLKEISRIWEGGCIIRARFLEELEKAFSEKEAFVSVLLAPVFKEEVRTGIESLRSVALEAMVHAIPLPAMLSGITYFDSMTTSRGNAHVIQAQRDFFGAHTFQKEIDGEFIHHEWE